MKERHIETEIAVVGGGLAGVCAAIASARLGKRTVLIHERPVLGGNSSSEVRVTPHGAAAFHHYARETGIISELMETERFRNHEQIFENGWTNSVWDLALYDACVSEELLDLYLNTTMTDVHHSGRMINRIRARTLAAETDIVVDASMFVDATGDGVLAAGAGCQFRRGSESKSEFGELHAPEEGCRDDEMGNSLHFRLKDVGRPVFFTAPTWAVTHNDADYFWKQGRKLKDLRGGYWWIEIAKPWDTIEDNETIRHELTRHLLGIWDWMKNRDPITKESCKTLALDWIGQIPGKRESRRIHGIQTITENDIQSRVAFDDEIAYGGWFLDLHTPGGLLAEHSEARSKDSYSPYGEKAAASYVGPYPLALRATIAQDIDNLFLAGRSLSCTHAAFGSIRVMGTLAAVGQAIGTAAARTLDAQVLPASLGKADISAIQQRLLRDDCFLLNTFATDPLDLAPKSTIKAGSEELLTGAGPDMATNYGGSGVWIDQIDSRVTDRLDTVHGQIFPVTGPLDRISVLLDNEGELECQVSASLQRIESIWDYRRESNLELAHATLVTRPGRRWYQWEVNLPDQGEQLLRLDLGPHSSVIWPSASALVPGCVSQFGIGANRMRTYGQGCTLSFSVSPPQQPFRAEKVVSGVSRPYREPGCWRPDPNRPDTWWIETTWPQPVSIDTIEITHGGQLLREYHAYPPGYRDSFVARSYRVEIKNGDDWIQIVEVDDNYKRHCVHTFQRRKTTAARILFLSSNGSTSPNIYSLRYYEDGAKVWNV